MKIKFYHISLSIVINFFLLAFLATLPDDKYKIIESEPMILVISQRNYTDFFHEHLPRELETQRSRVSAVSSQDPTHQTGETDVSSMVPSTSASNINTGQLDHLPRFVRKCPAFERDRSLRDERDRCLESLGRSVRDPSTPTYSIAIPPDKMKAYTEAYERQQELVGGPMPKVLAPDIGPGSDILF